MMDKEQLQQDIDAMREKLAEMESKLQVKEKKYFIPELGEEYWFITSHGYAELARNDGTHFDNYKIAVGNCYETAEDAEKADAKQKAYVRIVRALRDHEEEGEERDSFIFYSSEFVYPEPYHVSSYNYMMFSCLNKELFSTHDACRWVTDNMQNDLKIYFGE